MIGIWSGVEDYITHYKEVGKGREGKWFMLHA